MGEFISKLLEMAVSQGVWCVHYVYLFLRMLNENKLREDRYNATISQLSEKIIASLNHIEGQLDTVLDDNNYKNSNKEEKEND